MNITDITTEFLNGKFNTTDNTLHEIDLFLMDNGFGVDSHSCGSDDEVDQSEFDYLVVYKTDGGEERTIGIHEGEFVVGNEKGELF